MKLRAKIKRCCIPTCRCHEKWRFVVVDTDRLPSRQVVIAGARNSQPEALDAACGWIKKGGDR